MAHTQDPLHPWPVERWVELQSAFKSDWPRGISGFAALEIQKQWKEQDIDYVFKVYCPFGDVWNGMVVVNLKDTFYEVIIQCPSDNIEKLEEALKTTKVINWGRQVVVPFASQNVIDCLRNVVKNIGVEFTGTFYLDTFILENAPGDISLPPNVTFGPVTLDHVDLVDSTWPHRYPSSSWYFKVLINANSGFGLFIDNALVSWVFMKESGPLQHMYTVEEHRRKGYGELLLKMASKMWLKEEKPVFGFCFKDNVNACRMYRRIGFIETEPIAWCYLNKIKVK